MTRWKHSIVINPTDAMLKDMGDSGWELVAVTVTGWPWRPTITAYFKTMQLY